jgi:phosphoglycolate phosphatase-like HAD superfamily hydrolase
LKRFRLCLFDYNGTLQDDLHYIYECGPRRIFEKFGLPCPGIDEYRNQVSADFMRTFYWPHGIPPQVTAEDLNAIMKQAMKERGEPARLFPDALDAVRAVSAAGCRCVLVSAYDSAKLNEAVARHGLAPFFERIVGDARDKAADFRRLMDEFGARPEETAAVGDMVEDAEASGRAGVTPFLCPRGFHTRERIEAAKLDQPTIVIVETLADLTAHFTG